MNRIDRLFAMLLVLQSRQLVRAEDLARRFEVSPRTVYRDMAALSEMGIPIVSQPGEGYSLMPGYFLPPLVFSPDEATALMLGARLLAHHAMGRLPADAEQAMTKIAHILPRPAREHVARLGDIIHFTVVRAGLDLDDRRLVDIQRAIVERRPVAITYTGYQAAAATERVIEPHFLTYSEGAWYVSAYCRLRQASRSFRLNRIERYRLLRESFLGTPAAAEEQAIVEVRVRFDAAQVRWVHERQHYAFVRTDPNPDPESEDEIMVYHVHDLREVQSWLLGWGSHAEVLAPQALRDALADEARRLLARLAPSPPV